MRPAAATPATRRFAAAAVAAGLLGAIALPGSQVGLGAFLVSLAIAGAACMVWAFPIRGPHACLAALAVLLAGVTVLRDARWLVAIDLAGAACLASLAASRARSPLAVVRGAFAHVFRLPAAPAFVAWSSGVRPNPAKVRAALPAARGLLLAGALALTFGVLFASADAAFAQLTGDLLSPDVELGLLPARVAVFIGVVAVAGGLATVALAGPAAERSAREANAARRSDWIIALAVLNLLFAAFVAVQLTVLFAGNDHVLETTGLTYSEYAREGFGQLLVASLLTLAVLGAAWPHACRRAGRPDALELLLGLLCVLSLVVLASALRRLGLYEDAFGFTVARLSGHAAILWIGGVLLLVMTAGALRRSHWLALAIAGFTGLSLLAFTLVNPEGLVAELNVERFGETGRIDIGYLRNLSADATPALANLPRSRARCAVADQASRLQNDDDGFFAANAARTGARRTVARLGGQPRDATC